jgi:hypothetical protein
LCSSAGCLLYTDTFNVPPEVQLIAPPQMFKGRSELFAAMASDRDERPEYLQFSWSYLQVGEGKDCPRTAAEAEARAEEATRVQSGVGERRDIRNIALPGFGFFCVWVVVKDRAGASGFDGERFKVENQRPTAMLTLVAPKPLRWEGPTAYLPLYSDVRVSAASSEDPENDALEFRWTITGRNGESIPPALCLGASQPSQVCHRLDATGSYRFELRAYDGQIESDPVALPVLVMPDAPPCIEQTEPSFQLPRVVVFSTERTILRAVEVSDDGDPYPAGPGQQPQTQFIWRFRQLPPPGTQPPPFDRSVSTSMPTFGFAPDTFRPGDEIEVRLDVFDRVENRDFSTCGDQPECRLDPARECRQRVSWKVSYL